MTDNGNQNKSNANDWMAIIAGFLMILMGILGAVHYQEHGWINTSRFYIIPTHGRLAEFVIYLMLVAGLISFAFGFVRIFKSIFSKQA